MILALKKVLHPLLAFHMVAACSFLMTMTSHPAKAEVLWSHQAGPWQVTLVRGERGDAWCSWTVGGQPGLGRSQRSLSLQMRGDEAVLFLFIGGLSPPRWRTGDLTTLNVNNHPVSIELDQVRLLANGFSMSRGVVVRGVEARARFAADLVSASSVSLALPDGTMWVMDTAGLDATAPLMQRCLREAEEISALEIVH